MKIIGREAEKSILNALLKSEKAEFLAIYGRRRVGKTFLVKQFFEHSKCIFFHITGIKDGALSLQIQLFMEEIGKKFYGGIALPPCKNWMEAFSVLTKAILQTSLKSKKIVLFLDEFPWMATPRSQLMQALDYYWNHHWSHQPKIKLIICGSSASWILKKIIYNKAGLYNRLTCSLKLLPFTLGETKYYLKSQGIFLNHRQILELYMVIGGIPHYLSQVKKGWSAAQNIDALCFHQNGLLSQEFDRLFSALFNDADLYQSLCRIVASHREGIGQADLLKESKIPSGGQVLSRLKELEDAGFIMSFIPYGHKEKGIFYKIIDEYTLFYFSWIEPIASSIRQTVRTQGYWLSKSKMPTWKSWAGYAFEAICFKHIGSIQNALKIDPGAEIGSWRYVPKSKEERGAQIDLLFDRPDNVITICEIKFNEQPLTLDKDDRDDLVRKTEVYKKRTRTKKQIFLALIAAGGLKETPLSKELVTYVVTLDDLF